MVSKRKVVLVLLSLMLLVSLKIIGENVEPREVKNATKGDIIEFNGLCVYSRGEFSVLSNGSIILKIPRALEEGEIYTIRGKLLDGEENFVHPLNITRSSPGFSMETLNGAYWEEGSKCYIFKDGERIRLNRCIEVQKGYLVEMKGIFYGDTFYIVGFEPEGRLEEPRDGYPLFVEGVVLYNRTFLTLWNGREEIKVYPPYGISAPLGARLQVLGIARLHSTLTLYVNSPEDIKIVRMAEKKPIGRESVGDIAFGNCQIISASTYLRLNCTHLKLYNGKGKIGDILKFEALRRKSSLYCLRCTIIRRREALENSICTPKKGIVKIEGKVSWVKVYKNGFGLANITDGKCWVLLKLRKSLNLSLEQNQSISAFGKFTRYRGMPAFEIASRDGICLKNSSWGSSEGH